MANAKQRLKKKVNLNKKGLLGAINRRNKALEEAGMSESEKKAKAVERAYGADVN